MITESAPRISPPLPHITDSILIVSFEDTNILLTATDCTNTYTRNFIETKENKKQQNDGKQIYHSPYGCAKLRMTEMPTAETDDKNA